MSGILEPVRLIELDEIREARKRIADTIVRTPVVRLELGPDFPDIRLKLENLQPINAYKLRGAANAVAMLSEPERRRGVWTISAGNAGQGVAYAARKAGVPCSVVVIETAPASKVERMRRLGAKLIPVPFDDAWNAMEERAFDGAEGTFIHPFDDQNFVTGNATIGLEILEDAPDVVAVIAAIGGGGLITGLGSAVKALKPEVKVGERNRKQRRRAHCRSRNNRHRPSPGGSNRLSTGRAARIFSRGCGNGCGRSRMVQLSLAWKKPGERCDCWRKKPA